MASLLTEAEKITVPSKLNISIGQTLRIGLFLLINGHNILKFIPT